ncbi:hypothetical protein BDM02DRAFT_3186752 [Thelephora ganbajun]|uniref:Uncharacterized protein n=1 Tax=Thelephora ganbajun TaxID=370292 RepID=A0ACB6ZH31_THEGA|nr:hypothetical protein BDM02DRAFT_3186752 [Thelephora ganbajun]
MFGTFKIFLLALALSTAQAAPTHTKFIRGLEAACARPKAGGGGKCNPTSVAAFDTLNSQMTKLTQIFRQRPRNTPSSESA